MITALVQLLFLSIVIGMVQAQLTVQITYEPARGYFVCDQTGITCTVSGCGNGDCSILHPGFSVSNSDNGDLVYTTQNDEESFGTRSLSINGNDESSIHCDSQCDCQPLTASDKWCKVPVSTTRDDPFAGGAASQSTGSGVSDKQYTPIVHQSQSSAVIVGFFSSLMLWTISTIYFL